MKFKNKRTGVVLEPHDLLAQEQMLRSADYAEMSDDAVPSQRDEPPGKE